MVEDSRNVGLHTKIFKKNFPAYKNAGDVADVIDDLEEKLIGDQTRFPMRPALRIAEA